MWQWCMAVEARLYYLRIWLSKRACLRSLCERVVASELKSRADRGARWSTKILILLAN